MNRDFARSFLAAVLFSACGFATQASEPARTDTTAAPAKPHRFESEIAAFETWDRQNSWPTHAVLFVGSSSIRLWQTAENFPDLPVINRGFGGSEVSDVNHFFDRMVAKYKPRVIVFYSGDNDIAGGKSPQEVAADFAAFVETSRKRLPKTKVLILSIKPSPARWTLWSKSQEVNGGLANAWRNHASFRYVDIATPMLGADGQPRNELFLGDGLHLNAEGYKLWTKILAPPLSQAMK